MLTLHFGGSNGILFIGRLPIFGWFSCWISTQGLDLALRYQYVYRHRETWKQKSPSSAEVVKAGEEHFRIRNFFFYRRCWWIKPTPKFIYDYWLLETCLKMMLSIVAKLLHFWDTWHVGTAVGFCGSALSRWCWIRLKASTMSTATSQNCQAIWCMCRPICFGESCCFPMDETQTCSKCPTCPEQLK